MLGDYSIDKVRMLIEASTWAKLPNIELRNKLMNQCNNITEDELSSKYMEAAGGFYYMPYIYCEDWNSIEYIDGTLSLRINIDNIPEQGYYAEELIGGEEATTLVCESLTNSMDVKVVNVRDEDDFSIYELNDIGNIVRIFKNIVGTFGIKDLDELIASMCITSDRGIAINEVEYEVYFDEKEDNIVVKMLVPGGKDQYDLDLKIDLLDSHKVYDVKFSMDLKDSLHDDFTKVNEFIRKAYDVVWSKEDRDRKYFECINRIICNEHSIKQSIIDCINTDSDNDIGDFETWQLNKMGDAGKYFEEYITDGNIVTPVHEIDGIYPEVSIKSNLHKFHSASMAYGKLEMHIEVIGVYKKQIKRWLKKIENFNRKESTSTTYTISSK